LQNKNQKEKLGFADTGAFCHEIRAGNIPARNITSKKRTTAIVLLLRLKSKLNGYYETS
jgi:hypothetical protein